MGDSDWGTVYNAATDYLSLYKDGVAQHLTGGTALPAGKAAGDLTGWADGQQMAMPNAIYFTPWASSVFSATHIGFTILWDYGGRLNGRGRYVANAQMICTVNSLTATHTYDITGNWGEATLTNGSDPENPVAKLTGYIRAEHKHMTLHEETLNWYVSIKGDGSGRMVQV